MFTRPEVVVLPVAGLSTRNLPATKAMHKGFLCLNNLPIIQYAVDACAEAGVKEVIFIYSDEINKNMYQRYFSPNEALETQLLRKDKLELWEALRRTECFPKFKLVISNFLLPANLNQRVTVTLFCVPRILSVNGILWLCG